MNRPGQKIPRTEPKIPRTEPKYRNRIFRYPVRFLIPRNRNYRGKFGSLPRGTELPEMCWVWVLLYYWLYYYRLLYYVFVVLTLIVLWTFICIFILHYYSLWNLVKISFWTCYYMSLWSIRYCLLNTETEPKVPKPNFFGTDFYKEPIGTYLSRNRISVETEVPNRLVW